MDFKKVGIYLLIGAVASLLLALLLGASTVILPQLMGCGINVEGACNIFYEVFPLVVLIFVILAALFFFIFSLLMLYHSIVVKKKFLWAIAIFFIPFVQYVYYYLYIYKDKKEEKKK